MSKSGSGKAGRHYGSATRRVSGRSRIAAFSIGFEHELRQHHLPFVAPNIVTIFRVRYLAAPENDCPRTRAERHRIPGGGSKLLERRPTSAPARSRSSQRPWPMMRVSSGSPVDSAGDGAMNRMAGLPASREPQVNIRQSGQYVAVPECPPARAETGSDRGAPPTDGRSAHPAACAAGDCAEGGQA